MNDTKKLAQHPPGRRRAKNRARWSGWALSVNMDTQEEKEIIARIKEALARSRGYADFFSWPLNRDLEEYDIVKIFCEALEKANCLFLKIDSLKIRGRGNDPPDCEAKDFLGNRIGIEVTELVDSAAIKAFMNGRLYDWAEWDRDKLIRAIDERLEAKDRIDNVKGGPYESYIVVIHTDEPNLNTEYVGDLLRDVKFANRKLIDRAFLLLSFDAWIKSYPYVELEFRT
jgi:hypothetical protein